MLSKYGNCMHLLKIKNKLKIFFFFTNQVGKNSQYFVSILNKMIIPLAFVGYEMIIANSYNPTCTCGINVNNKLIPVAQSLKYNTSALKVKIFLLVFIPLKTLSGVIEHIKLLLIDSSVYAEEVEPTGVVPMEVSLER